ncbi:MAG: hypothetical protein HKL80_06385 [Acidimicrobiales bacterium]|nr:hypothetical protein [Acidimicrobiales bacterium]
MVHDGRSLYCKYISVAHQLCNFHILRELDAVSETKGKVAPLTWPDRTLKPGN